MSLCWNSCQSLVVEVDKAAWIDANHRLCSHIQCNVRRHSVSSAKVMKDVHFKASWYRAGLIWLESQASIISTSPGAEAGANCLAEAESEELVGTRM